MFYIAEHKNYSGKNPFKILHYKLFPINRVTKICRNDICEYGKLTIRTVNGRIDADKINRKLGAISRRLILPNTLKNCTIDCFSSKKFIENALFNTAYFILKQMKCERRLLEIAVIDTKGEFVRKSQQLLKVAGTVVIFTEKPQEYSYISAQNLQEFGADFVIRNRECTSVDIGFIVSPTENVPCIYIKNHRFELDWEVFSLPSGFTRQIDSNISTADFLAAAQVFSKAEKIDTLKSEKLRVNGKTVSVSSLF